jgi:hypothetical protein
MIRVRTNKYGSGSWRPKNVRIGTPEPWNHGLYLVPGAVLLGGQVGLQHLLHDVDVRHHRLGRQLVPLPIQRARACHTWRS